MGGGEEDSLDSALDSKRFGNVVDSLLPPLSINFDVVYGS